jgi:hypothetical protein
MKVKTPKPAKPAVRIFEDVPKLWPGGTVVCIAGGPSLTVEDVNYVRGKVDGVVGVNDAYRIAPWIDVLYACDAKWWDHHKGVRSFTGLKYSLQRQAAKWRGVSVLQNTGTDGLQMKPNGLKTGKNSGYQAINLAVHLGAKRILLLGYDMEIKHGSKSHWFGDHPWGNRPPVSSFRGMFRTLVAPLEKHGVTVINCSRSTSLDAFPCMALELALPAVQAMAVA